MSDPSFHPDAYCGLYCAACPNYMNTQKSPENPDMDNACKGCKSDLLCKSWCARCNLKECAKSRGIEFCHECGDYPCDNLKSFKNDPSYPYHGEVYEYLGTIKTKGKKAWLADMKKRWNCVSCGTSFSWWTKTCDACGMPVAGYLNPAVTNGVRIEGS